jgi:myo-inositol-1(or 4)-monophosphatase
MINNLDLLKQIRNDAEYLVREAGKILTDNQDKFQVVKMKDTVDLATSADLASEKFIMDFIKNKYPDHGIYSEEAGVSGKDKEFQWIIDPLDGTKEYSRGLREYNCLIAIEQNQILSVGAMFRNGVNELYSCQIGCGATLQEKSIRVSDQSDINKSFVGFHVPTKTHPDDKITREMNVLNTLVRTVYRVRPGWDDAKCCGWVARGVLDAHIISASVNKWYDIASGILLVEEAGGIVSDWYGDPIMDRNLSNGVILSNRNIYPAILKLTNFRKE